jgi:hypothetical protein
MIAEQDGIVNPLVALGSHHLELSLSAEVVVVNPEPDTFRRINVYLTKIPQQIVVVNRIPMVDYLVVVRPLVRMIKDLGVMPLPGRQCQIAVKMNRTHDVESVFMIEFR